MTSMCRIKSATKNTNFFFIYFIRSIVLFDLILSSKYFTFINEFFLEIFFAKFILLSKLKLLFSLNGFFLVTAQIILSISYLFFASLEILKCPLCAGSKVPPRIPIFFFIFLFVQIHISHICN